MTGDQRVSLARRFRVIRAYSCLFGVQLSNLAATEKLR